MLVPTSAQAHDEIAGTSPSANQTVQAGAFDVSVTFGEDILVSPGNQGEVVQVTDASGKIVSNGCVAVDGVTLSTPVDVDQPGKYSVEWRSVSSDGHSNEGTFDFTVENSSGYVSSGIPAVSDKCAAANPKTTSSSTDNTGLIAICVAVGLILLATSVAVLRWVRRGKKA